LISIDKKPYFVMWSSK